MSGTMSVRIQLVNELGQHLGYTELSRVPCVGESVFGTDGKLSVIAVEHHRIWDVSDRPVVAVLTVKVS
jgi:hypothetical protein